MKIIFPFLAGILSLSALNLAAQTTSPGIPADSSGITIKVNSRGVVISGETIICPGSMTALKVEGQYKSYLWNTGHTTPAIPVFQPGTYTVTVTTEGGCELSSSVTVRYSSSPCL